jgi:uncharacterized cupin superfamily protein
MSTAPVRPFASETVDWTVLDDVPNFRLRYRHLSRAALGEAYRIGVAIEELPPGMRTAPAHYHLYEEEHVFVLEGRVAVRDGSGGFELGAGGYVCFPAGRRSGHCLSNPGEGPCRYVIVGERRLEDVVVYTDTGKLMVPALGRRALYDLAARRSYWEGEATGLAAAPPDEADPPPAAVAPLTPVVSSEVEWNDEGEGTVFGGRSRHLTYAALGHPRYHVGMLIEAPAPGMRLAPRHYHMREEEHALILEGEVTLLLGEARHVMRPGDYVCFPAGQRVGHSMLNSGEAPCRYLMIGGNDPNEVIVYPDSQKVLVRALDAEDGPAPLLDMTARRGYWDGEVG